MSEEAAWVLGRWERAGFPVTIRMATAYQAQRRVPGYEYRAVVGIELRNPDALGRPGDDEWDDLEVAESTVCEVLEAEGASLCVLVITGNGLRDLIFYVRDPEQAKARMHRARNAVRSHQLEFAIESESDWRVYNFFSEKIPMRTGESATDG